jgi:hypothetical protein
VVLRHLRTKRILIGLGKEGIVRRFTEGSKGVRFLGCLDGLVCMPYVQITDHRLAPSKQGAQEEPTSAPWATLEETLSF